jgi:hypothetical protein
VRRNDLGITNDLPSPRARMTQAVEAAKRLE